MSRKPGPVQWDHLERLDLARNRLGGSIPSSLGELPQLHTLSLSANRLSGRVPPELGSLGRLERLDLGLNKLEGEIPAELGALASLTWLDLGRNFLSGPIPSELGDLGDLVRLALNDNHLNGTIPADLGQLTAVEFVGLADNQLTGRIPPRIGALTRLKTLDLSGNQLTGPIPAELVGLADLREFRLSDNAVSGSIPSGLGRSDNLTVLELAGNRISGAIPAELGNLANLVTLNLGHNRLSGPLPSELGRATSLESVDLRSNGLVGPLPHEFGDLDALRSLILADNPELAGPLPVEITSIGGLELFMAGGTGLCRPADAPFDAWFRSIPERRIVRCAGGAAVYLTQAVQSWDDPVPLLAGKPALLRVFVTAPEDATVTMPDHLTLVPFLSDSEPDSSVVESVPEMAADPGGHELLRGVRTMLPVERFDVTAREPVISSAVPAGSSTDLDQTLQLLGQLSVIRILEGGSGHWLGIFGSPRPSGLAEVSGALSVSVPDARIIAHELGHNVGLLHAPCGFPWDVDPWFPHANGGIGSWGYDFEGGALVGPRFVDLMSYCTHAPHWISDYFFNKALNNRLADGGSAAGAMTVEANPVRSLLIWGGRDEDGVPYLDPAFVVDAAPSLPGAGGEYRVSGATAEGTDLFSFAFDIAAIADAEGAQASFAFALPVQPGWEDSLASITLFGPGGSATLDDSTDQPMAILRDPGTGQVRAFLRDPGPLTQAAADAGGLGGGAGLEVLFSRGIPGAEAWRR